MQKNKRTKKRKPAKTSKVKIIHDKLNLPCTCQLNALVEDWRFQYTNSERIEQELYRINRFCAGAHIGCMAHVYRKCAEQLEKILKG